MPSPADPLFTPPPPSVTRDGSRLAWAQHALQDANAQLQRASTDAGFRSYWRSTGRNGSHIVMDSPPELEDPRPWLRTRDLLEAGGVRVPRVLAADAEAGFLLLEDLGGPTLAQWLSAPGAAAADADVWFDATVGQLLTLQAIEPPVYLGAFDTALLQRDADLFETWFLRRHLQLELEATELQALRDVQARLQQNLLGQAQVLTHRDFMPRNLMPVSPGPAVLDFQDSVRGPIAYDPVSLFKDAFLGWPLARVDDWLVRYHARAVQAGLPVPTVASAFLRDADWCGIQRHLKILGIFARLHYRDDKPKYLADAPRFVGYLEEVLPRYAELQPLTQLLECRIKPAMRVRAAATE